MSPIHGIADLRVLLRRAAGDGRMPSEWWTLAVAETRVASERCLLVELGEPGSAVRELVAQEARFSAVMAIAYMLEALDEFERAEGIDGPIRVSNSEAREAVDQVLDVVRGRSEL